MGWLLSSPIITLSGAFLAACAGWFATNFVAAPISRFYDLRGKVHGSLVFTANARARLPSDPRAYDDAQAELRRLATNLSELQQVPVPIPGWYLKLRGYDLVAASSGLIGLSNTLLSTDGSRAVNRHVVEAALRLPLEDSPERIERIRASWNRKSE